jgi:hypothetical protein
MLHFEPFDGTTDQWDAIIEAFADHGVFQTSAWLRFLAESQNAQPVTLTLLDGAQVAGYFAGMIVTKGGCRILGSPFIGWTTEHMGIRLLPSVSKRAAVEALTRYAFGHLRCMHLEMTDRSISPDDIAGLGFQHAVFRTAVIDLTADEDRIYSDMSSKSCRYCIRKAEKLGVIIEEARDEAFADEYYAQLLDVFAKQDLVPTYGPDRVRSLVRHLLPTGNLLLLRARDPAGRCIGTSIFLGMNDCSYFWGNASWRADQRFCPNEPLQWYAIRYWKRRGMRAHNLGGGGDYKRKYGGQPTDYYRLWKSKYPWIALARDCAFRAFKLKLRVLGWWRGERHSNKSSPLVTRTENQEADHE